jgi:hypothetical protein
MIISGRDSLSLLTDRKCLAGIGFIDWMKMDLYERMIDYQRAV